jgi:hypothetical protein
MLYYVTNSILNFQPIKKKNKKIFQVFALIDEDLVWKPFCCYLFVFFLSRNYIENIIKKTPFEKLSEFDLYIVVNITTYMLLKNSKIII